MTSAAQLGLIFLFAIIGGVLAVRFKQPSVIGLLIVGALVGPNAFALITDTEMVDIVIEVGAVLLLFTVGIEFNIQKLFDLGAKALFVGIAKIGFVFFAAYQAALFLGMDSITALYIGVIFSITSTVIVIKILEQKGFANRAELPLLIAVLIIEDIFAVFALTFFSSLSTAQVNTVQLVLSLLFSLGLLLGVYFILRRIIKPFMEWLIKHSAEDTIIFTSLGLCVGMSYLAYLIHLSPSVGAFLAGSIVASLPNAKIFDHAIHPFILTFTSLFFLSVGTLINFQTLQHYWYFVLIFLLINILVKYGSIGLTTYLTGFSGEQAVFSGIAMLSVGEFSLLIAKEASVTGIALDLVSITAAIIVLSTLIMSLSISHVSFFHRWTVRLLPRNIFNEIVFVAQSLRKVSTKTDRHKGLWENFLHDWKSILKNLVLIIGVFAVPFLLWYFLPVSSLTFLLDKKGIFYPALFIAVILLGYILFCIARQGRDLFRRTETFFTLTYPQQKEQDRKITRNIVITLLLFVTLFGISILFLLFDVPHIYHFFPLLLLFIAIIFSLHSGDTFSGSFAERRKEHRQGVLKSKL